VKGLLWVEPSPLSTNINAGSSWWQYLALRFVAHLSKPLRMSDRFAMVAQKAPSSPTPQATS